MSPWGTRCTWPIADRKVIVGHSRHCRVCQVRGLACPHILSHLLRNSREAFTKLYHPWFPTRDRPFLTPCLSPCGLLQTRTVPRRTPRQHSILLQRFIENSPAASATRRDEKYAKDIVTEFSAYPSLQTSLQPLSMTPSLNSYETRAEGTTLERGRRLLAW